MINRNLPSSVAADDRESRRYPLDLDGSTVSVAALVRSVKDLLESRYRLMWVAGEISNVTLARSGHWYFVLKDAEAQVRCVMFRHRNQYLDWTPREGLQVEVRATVTLYEARGEFQLNVESMRQAGRGALYEAFLRLRDKLQSEGLFDVAHKRPLPADPKRIGVVTSLRAAALRDILSTLRRRNPTIPVIVYPAGVQGGTAAAELVAAIEQAGQRRECDVLIVARGGGGIEDLWAFNDEQLARAIRSSPMPVITGIGHETDFTIADFVADVRAPTPTAAAELVAPALVDVLAHVAGLALRISERTRRIVESRMQALDYLQRRLVDPAKLVVQQRRSLSQLSKRLARTANAIVDRERSAVAHSTYRLLARLPQIKVLRNEAGLRATLLMTAVHAAIKRSRALTLAHGNALRHLDPLAVLGRGYSIARDRDGHVVRDAAQVGAGDSLDLTLAQGALTVTVDSSKP